MECWPTTSIGKLLLGHQDHSWRRLHQPSTTDLVPAVIACVVKSSISFSCRIIRDIHNFQQFVEVLTQFSCFFFATDDCSCLLFFCVCCGLVCRHLSAVEWCNSSEQCMCDHSHYPSMFANSQLHAFWLLPKAYCCLVIMLDVAQHGEICWQLSLVHHSRACLTCAMFAWLVLISNIAMQSDMSVRLLPAVCLERNISYR